MERTPTGTPVGVDDPYDHAGRCDHLTSDGRCRFALERAGDSGGSESPLEAGEAGDNGGQCPPSSRPAAGDDPEFAAERRAEGYDCVAADEDTDWRDCPHYRSTTDGRECRRCGLDEVRMAHTDGRPLLEEHHLSYGSSGDDDDPAHEITVALCRWCHAKVHEGWARIDDDAGPDAEALAAREERRSKEQAEFGFRTAAERDDRE